MKTDMSLEALTESKPQLSLLTRVARRVAEIVEMPLGYKPYFDIEGLRKVTVDLISESKRSIRIIEGRFNAKVYNDGEVIDALEKAVKRGVKVEIISGPDPDPESTRLWAMVNNSGVAYYQHRIGAETHSTIVDDDRVRVEYPHGLMQTTRDGHVSLFDENNLAFGLLRGFDKLKSEAIKMEKVVFAE